MRYQLTDLLYVAVNFSALHIELLILIILKQYISYYRIRKTNMFVNLNKPTNTKARKDRFLKYTKSEKSIFLFGQTETDPPSCR